MKFIQIIYKTALHIAIEKNNVEIVKLLISNKNINVNRITVLLAFSIYEISYFLLITFE